MASFDLPVDYSLNFRPDDQPTEILVLDGNHMTTSDLAKCEHGRYILQVRLVIISAFLYIQ